MFETFQALAGRSPRAAAVIDGATGAITDRAGLLELVESFAGRLAQAGIRPGDAIALQLPNSASFVAAILAASRLGVVVVPIDRDAPETEVGAILTHFAIRGLVFSTDRSNVSISTRAVSHRLPLPEGSRVVKLTSGSTGKPKGIVTTEANLAADCRNICATMDIRSEDLNLGAIPFSHSYGFSNLVMPLILQGTAVVASNDYLPQTIVDLANAHRCTVAPLIPMVFDHLVTAAHGDFETVRTFLSAGAPLPAATSRRFRERFHHQIHSFYGCSECGGIAYDRVGGAVERGSVGTPMEGVELISDEGRLIVRSESIAAGYLHDATTFEKIAARRFVTDDIVEVRDGEIHLVGRAGDTINTAGKKVNPREVEAIILQIDGVTEVKVYGEPAGARGEVVAAAVVATPEVTREQVREFCRARLSSHKVPRIVKLIDEIPRDERGKVKRAALAAL